MIAFDCSFTSLTAEDLASVRAEVLKARDTLVQGTGAGSDFLGWVDLPVAYDREEYMRIKEAADRIRSDSDTLIVCGIGGSYLGAKAAVDFLSSGDSLRVLFAGQSLSQRYLSDLMAAAAEGDISVNVISKSGTTTEPAVAFRLLRRMMEEKYGPDASSRIYATTDRARGALKEMATQSGYETFIVPDDVGGRYSVLTAVGLLPIAAAGIDIDALMAGAAHMREISLSADYEDCPPLLYAAARNLLYRRGKKIEITVNFEPSAHYIGEWWKQLFGESEGKDHRGIYPASCDFTTDLHSMGQYIQDGERDLMETVIRFREEPSPLTIPSFEGDADGLNYLSGRTLDFVNDCARRGTIQAHREGGVEVMEVSVDREDAYSLGELLYFYEFSCGVSGYLLGVNPFNQPGVENYKKNMFKLLGKPGYA